MWDLANMSLIVEFFLPPFIAAIACQDQGSGDRQTPNLGTQQKCRPRARKQTHGHMSRREQSHTRLRALLKGASRGDHCASPTMCQLINVPATSGALHLVPTASPQLHLLWSHLTL